MRLSIAIAFALVSYSALAAQPLRLAGARDQAPARLVTLPAPSAQIERKPVSFSWKLDPTQTVATPAPFVAESREYWQTVDATELQNGVPLKMSSSGSLIRISPLAGARALDEKTLQIRDAGGAAELQSVASAKQLAAAGMDVQDGTVVAKLSQREGADTYTVQAKGAQGRYLVHVFEPLSSDVLRATTDRQHALAGDRIRLDVDFAKAGKRATAMQAEALLVAPDGRSWPVAMNGSSVDVQLPRDVGSVPGLWELQVFASADGVQRDARTAFAVAAPTARFNGVFAFNAKTMRMALPVRTGSTGRYEARGTLFATGPDGILHPVSEAHTANWIKRGSGMLVLQFDRNHVPAGYGAPFEVRQLELNDQSRMAPLESRERAGIAR